MCSIKFNKKKCTSAVLAFMLITSLTGCSNKQGQGNSVTPTPTPSTEAPALVRTEKQSYKLNTIIKITLYNNDDVSIIDGAFALCDQYEALLSRTIPTSEISQLNNSNNQPYTVSDDTLELLERGLEYCRVSDGAFDLSVEPLTSLWNFGGTNQRLPQPEEIEEALTHIGYQNIAIDDHNVTLGKEGMGLDLGAIAKGFIADKIKEYLLDQGVECAMINLGGNVLCVGQKPDGSPFTVGIQKPYETHNEMVAVMELGDKSVVSSGIYERYFEVDGVKYHHILNPSTGYPYDNNLLGVTIISDKSTDGDALSTTCFALGLEKGLELIDSMEDTYAVFITKDDKLHYSKGFLEAIPTTEVK